MKIGILGGAFNPPHIGHLILANEIFEKLKLDKVFFIPTNISPHKEGDGPSASDRLQMTKLAVADSKNFEVLNLEIKRGGTSYTIDTVNELKNKYPGDELYLIIGSDLANDFSTWKDFESLRKISKIVVGHRQSYPLAREDDFIILDITQIDLSSSHIRELIRENKSIDELVTKEVLEYINQYNLYRK